MSSDIEDMLKKMTSRYTPEYLVELSKQAYKDDREYPECFSNWYPHIVDFGYFKHADIISNQIFTWEETEEMHREEVFDKVDWNRLNEILKPTLDKMEPYKLYNIKNGCFSNKFDFKTCLATKEDLAQQLWKINYQSTMFETGGYTELVVREFIPFDYKEVPTIYNGMPLREEVRVFYNLDKKKIEYIKDYWDYEYCYKNITDATDRIIFNWFHNRYFKGDNWNARKYTHRYELNKINGILKSKIDTLKFDDELKGIWSIDFMWHNEELYLIDMARGFRSAYWDVEKLSDETYKELMNNTAEKLKKESESLESK